MWNSSFLGSYLLPCPITWERERERERERFLIKFLFKWKNGCKIDAKLLLGWITSEYNNSLHHTSLIMNCITFISQIVQMKISHCFCKANKCVHILTKRDSTFDQDMMFFDSLFVELINVNIFLNNNLGLYHERPCLLNVAIVVCVS